MGKHNVNSLRMKRFILTLCLGFCLLSLKAQQIQLKGILVDETTQSPIANAIIKIEDKTISTDSEGFFSLSELKPGRLGLWIEATGYEPYSMVVIFTGEAMDLGKISLRPFILSAIDNGLAEIALVAEGSDDESEIQAGSALPVSYTHLTLPTIYSV